MLAMDKALGDNHTAFLEELKNINLSGKLRIVEEETAKLRVKKQKKKTQKQKEENVKEENEASRSPR